ncbi:MAG: (d)CMP kinase [Oscillospiraceae bacterium]|jgi:cytidylate kinase|nr:(d)CMP kinase [Oscillospiraceae bacterium]
MIQVAIDGPSAVGKSSIARLAAKKLGFIYIDTGALYRAIGLAATLCGIDANDAARVEAMLANIRLELRHDPDGAQRVFLNGNDVSEDIRTPKASMAASAVSAMPAVRAFLLDSQRKLASQSNCILDGRDIGTVVLPNAQLKLFLTATADERARRRFHELQAKGISQSFDAVKAELIQRDEQDTNRAVAPLKPAADSVLLDTTDLSLEEAVARVTALIQFI